MDAWLKKWIDEWDVEYERMKKLPFKTFEKLCGAGVIMYNKSNDALNN